MLERRALDELTQMVLDSGPSEVELKLLNVIAIMSETIQQLSRETVGVDFYIELERAIDHNIEAMLAVVDGRMH